MPDGITVERGHSFSLAEFAMEWELQLSDDESDHGEFRERILRERLQIAEKLGPVERQRRIYLADKELREQPVVAGPVFTPDECQLIVENVKEHGLKHGWETQRHDAFPTVDIPCQEVTKISNLVFERVNSNILQFISKHFGIRNLGVQDMFFVSYSQHTQKGLDLHTDGCLISFNVLLNNHRDFTGGGTYFKHLDKVFMLQQGECLVHDSKLLHAGCDITSGERIILVGFVNTLPFRLPITRHSQRTPTLLSSSPPN